MTKQHATGTPDAGHRDLSPTVHQVWPTSADGPAGRSGPVLIQNMYSVTRPRPTGRPWVALTMITSIDGATQIDGNSRQLGNANDSAVLKAMRSVSDVILVGAASVVADHYGPPSKPGQRIGVVTRSIDLDLTTPLFTSGAGFLVTTDEAPVPATGVDAVRCGRGEIDFALALEKIDALIGGANVIHLEGGPVLNGLMIAAGLVDEINHTTAPLIVGGSSSRLAAGAPQLNQRFALAHQLVDDDGYVFSRWVIRRDTH